MLNAPAVVDLGTGGGERLLRLLDRLAARGEVPNRVAATEGWEPNVKVARESLRPRRIEVYASDSEAGDRVPCSDGTFDPAMNRHEAINAEEIERLLMPCGRFLTQQVHGLDVPEFREWFGSIPQYTHATPENLCRELEEVGLNVETLLRLDPGTIRVTQRRFRVYAVKPQ
ncbi:MAG: hypothetical protein SOW59_09785 [Corynebacterium sp.]|nr:hypothetical protein [Corynebacterium sp.]